MRLHDGRPLTSVVDCQHSHSVPIWVDPTTRIATGAYDRYAGTCPDCGEVAKIRCSRPECSRGVLHLGPCAVEMGRQ